jgi:hypothetical protein
MHGHDQGNRMQKPRLPLAAMAGVSRFASQRGERLHGPVFSVLERLSVDAGLKI